MRTVYREKVGELKFTDRNWERSLQIESRKFKSVKIESVKTGV